ncbi:hypothetical protein GYMLUDRAFT_178708 [Collybiopsis luxurians FD-317 M1]|uniref:Uncharacterized protein n=1 Tax=Collybiopsis luxurians FD-317 M1 TaxID=944289 RepID=A0A0D0AT76_9AGAR|nr:hypothetical protein GYMLUDRAFT_178708 [Collybiopsis luxurians FD-317 M1]
MTSTGKRQHYAFALIETLLQHLLTCYKIGLLYDVACILHRSCIKWGFLKECLHCIAFAISVFHAYGHSWACQCVYHPRKSIVGFGLMDGEGCERLWHSLSCLIPYLRVCGYNTHIYTLNCQIHFADRESLENIGKWIARQWSLTLKKRAEADEDVRRSGRSPTFL